VLSLLRPRGCLSGGGDDDPGPGQDVGMTTEHPPGLIGLIGGMSWESTALYYRLLNEGVRDRLGGLHSARVLLSSVDFADIETLQRSDRWDEAGELLAAEGRRLAAGGAELVLLCTNTMHKVAAQIEGAIDVPLLHIADVTADAVRAAGLTTVALLGTAYTMEQPFLRDRLAGAGLAVEVPDAEERAEVHRIIFDELCLGVVRDESRAAVAQMIAAMAESGCEGVVLGCTELELLIRTGDVDIPVFATTQLHVDAALDRITG
jgi:aspartate racemase